MAQALRTDRCLVISCLFMHYLFRVIIIILHVFVRIVVAIVTATCNRDLSCLSSIPYSILRLIIGVEAANV